LASGRGSDAVPGISFSFRETHMGLLDFLNRYDTRQELPPPQVLEDFDRVANEASPEDIEVGLEDAFNSEVTPPFEQMVAQLYDESDDDQRAGVLNEILGSLGGAGQVAPAVGGGVLGGALGGLLRRAGQGNTRVSPADARSIPARDIEIAAAEARRQNPGIVQKISRFDARNPQLGQVLGQAALSILMSGMARRRRG
jgi:hypothetical protein